MPKFSPIGPDIDQAKSKNIHLAKCNKFIFILNYSFYVKIFR